MTIGLSSYVPTYVQGVLGTGALVAGFALAALTVGWPLAATFSGRIYTRIGFRDTALIGAAFVLLGAVLCTLLGRTTPVWQVAGACFVVGVGLGFLSSPVVVAVQSVVGWDRRGVVTGTNMFSRSIGSALGAAVLGAVANATLASRLAHPPTAVARALPDDADQPRARRLRHHGPRRGRRVRPGGAVRRRAPRVRRRSWPSPCSPSRRCC